MSFLIMQKPKLSSITVDISWRERRYRECFSTVL